MTFEEWMEFGITQGWCGPPVCETHDGLPLSEAEEEVFYNGDDPCVHIIRLYADEHQKKSVEENHSPTNWRNTYTVTSGNIHD